jgi:hypothetical protein
MATITWELSGLPLDATASADGGRVQNSTLVPPGASSRWRRMRLRAPSLLALGSATFLTGEAGAQAPQRKIVRDGPVCPTCRIELTLVARLGDADGPGEITVRPVEVEVDRRGYFYVLPIGGAPPVVFDSTGRYVRTMGRVGGGPGESRSPTAILSIEGDSLLLFDSGLRRVSLFDPQWKYVRSWASAGAPVWSAYRLSYGRTLVNGHIATAQSVGLPLWTQDDGGSRFAIWGEQDGEYRPWDPYTVRRRLSASASGVWSSHTREYVLNLYATNGTKRLTLTRAASWFVAPDPAIPVELQVSPSKPPSSVVLDVSEDTDGLVWVLVARHKETWPSGLGPETRIPSGTYYPIVDMDKARESLVEVIDPVRGELLATLARPIAARWLRGRYLIAHEQDSAGPARVTVWRLRFSR